MKMELVVLDQEKVRSLFDSTEDISEIVVGLYKMVFPDWDDIKSIEGWPITNQRTNEEIFKLFIQKGKTKNGRGSLSGGLWMNNGFSTLGGAELPDWTVNKSAAKVNY